MFGNNNNNKKTLEISERGGKGGEVLSTIEESEEIT